MAVRPIVLESMFMCILLGHQRMINEILARIGKIEEKLRNDPPDLGRITAYTGARSWETKSPTDSSTT